jgi:hypothetical protein
MMQIKKIEATSVEVKDIYVNNNKVIQGIQEDQK